MAASSFQFKPAPERWVSGLNQAFAKRSYGQKLYRGFKSRPLRQHRQPKLRYQISDNILISDIEISDIGYLRLAGYPSFPVSSDGMPDIGYLEYRNQLNCSSREPINC